MVERAITTRLSRFLASSPKSDDDDALEAFASSGAQEDEAPPLSPSPRRCISVAAVVSVESHAVRPRGAAPFNQMWDWTRGCWTASDEGLDEGAAAWDDDATLRDDDDTVRDEDEALREDEPLREDERLIEDEAVLVDACQGCGKSTLRANGDAMKNVLICDGCEAEYHYRCSGLLSLPKSNERFACGCSAVPKF